MNANELIVNAYYLSDVVSRELETVSGSQQADGLRMLNAILQSKSAKGFQIPYYSHQSFNAIIGQEKYFVESLVDVSTVTFNIDDVRYSMIRMGRKKYFGSPRIDSIQSLPYAYYAERTLKGTDLYLYDLPAGNYLINITGKFSLTKLAGQDELANSLDDYYIDYLEYALAKRICHFYNIKFASGKAQLLMEKERDIFQVDPPDMSIRKISTLRSHQGYTNYAWANLGNGWIPDV